MPCMCYPYFFQVYRDTIEHLNHCYPNQGMLSKFKVARFMGVSERTVRRKIAFNRFGMLKKADLARQICL